MGIGKKDNSIRMEFPFDHDDFDKNPKSTVSFQPTIELVERGRLGTAASPSNLVYALINGKTVLVATENLTIERPQILRDLRGLTPDIQRQAAEHFKGRVLDPDRFQLEDFVWAMDLLNRDYEYSNLPEEDFEVWRKCFGLVRDLRVERRMFEYVSFVGYATGEDFPDVQIAIHPVHQVDDLVREAGPRFPGKNASISGFTIYAAFELGRAWQGKEENLKAAIERFIERETQSKRLALRSDQVFHEYFAVGIPNGPDDKDRNIYVSWSNWEDYRVSSPAIETLPDLYERGVPQQIAYIGQVVKGFLAEKDKREAVGFAENMSQKAMEIRTLEAKARETEEKREGYIPKGIGHGWVGPQPPPKELEDTESQ
ncbi:hypothetical protein KY335_04220 [Candidatus Woesearchaeota archaeon]|nr:hypothetical protein [Candidatus Woesearchaeota archaeon]